MVPPVVSVEELASLLVGAAPPVLLDVRWRLGGPPGREEHLAGHLPGAVFVDLETDLSAPVRTDGRGGRHPLPTPEVAVATLRRLGVRADRGVVVHDAADGTAAARAWWLLRHVGHRDVRLLDGGYRAWVAAGRPVETGPVQPPEPGDLVAGPGVMPVLDAEAALRLASDGVLLDARAAARFRGETEPVDPVAGHVPGAVSAPTTGNVDAAGRLLPVDALRERFASLGVTEDAPVGAYCGSGVTAAHTVLALELAGHRAALYAGSWSDWVSDPDRPVATGT